MKQNKAIGITEQLSSLPHNAVDRLGKVVDVLGVQASHGYPAVLGLSEMKVSSHSKPPLIIVQTYHVNMPLLSQDLHLLLTQASEAEHANLARDVVPLPRGPLGLQPLLQSLAHLDDPAAHSAQVLLPLRKQLSIIEDQRRRTRTVRRRIRNLRALQDGQLAGNICNRLHGLRARRRDKVERTRALAVQAKILRKRLRNAQLEALGDKVLDGPRVAREVARREALVRAVEEGEVVALAHGGGDLLPLVLGRVYAGGVVGTGVQQHDGAARGGADGGEHAIDVEALGVLGEVWVVCGLEADVGEDLLVVGPGWAGDVN